MPNKYENYTPTDWAIAFIEAYGWIDGAHHKTWVLDRIARVLHGTPVLVTEYPGGFNFNTAEPPSAEYTRWVESMLGEKDEDGEYEYGYDEGIAP